VDPCLHCLQGKTELVTAGSDALGLLIEFYGEKLAETLQHQAHAREVRQYDANNTYQYIINREEVQLTWLAKAITDGGGALPDVGAASTTPPGRSKDAARGFFEADLKGTQAFLGRWRTRVDAVENARHRAMLRVILGETREQQRFFEQALAGRTDLLGRRSRVAAAAAGDVLPARWIE
jgi:hypothetical protein